jgi:hypothetical protein
MFHHSDLKTAIKAVFWECSEVFFFKADHPFEADKNNVMYEYELLSDMMHGSSEQPSGVPSKKKGVYCFININTFYKSNIM